MVYRSYPALNDLMAGSPSAFRILMRFASVAAEPPALVMASGVLACMGDNE